MRKCIQHAAAIIGSIVFATVAQATDFIIANGDIAGLKAAINTANANNQNDNIILAGAGTYNLTTVDNNVYNGLPIITADNGHSVVINGNNSTIQRVAGVSIRIFDVTGNVTLANLIVYNGNANGGGSGFRSAGGTCVLQNCTFRNNLAFAAAAGGAASNDTGSLTVTNCIFDNNTSNYGFNFAGPGGAGIYNGTGTVTVSDSTFTNNVADGSLGGLTSGGALFNAPNGTMTVTNCTFDNNMASELGGAVLNAGNFTARRCTFSFNFVTIGDRTNTAPDASGGAIGNTGTALLENCTIARNNAVDSQSAGGGIFNDNGSVTLSGCTLSGNTAPAGLGGGVYNLAVSNGPSTVVVRNTILKNSTIAFNLVNSGAGSSTTSQGYNLSSDNGGGFLTGSGDQINTDPQLDANGLQDNGGPTKTIALLPSSPAIDKGKSFGLTTDQRGQTRPNELAAYSNAAGGDGSDIGAFEVFDFVEPGPVFTVNTNADHDDGVCGSLDCSLRDAITAANNASGANTINIAVTGTITLTGGQLPVTDSTTVNGPGARLLEVSGNNASRVFNFSGGTSTLSGLTIRNGFVTGNGIVLGGSGGGLSNFGTLTVNDCAFTGNKATACRRQRWWTNRSVRRFCRWRRGLQFFLKHAHTQPLLVFHQHRYRRTGWI